MANFSTKVDLSERGRIPSGKVAIFDGGMQVVESFFIETTRINPDPTNASSDDVLSYDGILDQYVPKSLPSFSLSDNRVVFGMDVTNDEDNRLCFNVAAGRYKISGSTYNFDAYTACTSSGDASFTRYDLLYVTGGSGSDIVYVLEGTPDASPVIPTEPSDSLVLAIVEIPSGLTSGGTAPNIITTNQIPAKNVGYVRGVYSNVADYLDNNYVYPQIKTLTNDVNELEYGNSASTITLTWELNKKVYTQDETLTSTSLSKQVRNTTLNSQTITGNSSSTAYTYTLEVNDSFNTDSENTSVLFYGNIYYGNFSGTTINTSGTTAPTNEAIGLSSSQFFKNKNITLNVNGNGNYFWFGYPAIFGDSILYFNGMLNNDFTKYTQTMTNQHNHDESYIFYRTNNVVNGTGMTLTIT